MKNLIFAMLLMLSYSINTFAFNTSFLSYSPVFYFTEQDSKIMNQALTHALNQSGNKKITWKNPNTGANGYLIPSNMITKNRLSCRKVEIFNEANHVTGKSSYLFCKIHNEWKLTQ